MYNKNLMSKLIVTHIRPDLDASCSVWLIKRYYPHFGSAEVVFLPAGNTYQDKPADTDPNIIHVDTGMGRFDHHQFKDRFSAALRIYEHLARRKRFSRLENEAMERLVELVTKVDNFEEVYLSEPTADVYEMLIPQVLEGIKIEQQNDHAIIEIMEQILDGLLAIIKRKIQAEAEIADGEEFWVGKVKCIHLCSNSKETSKLAQKGGYQLVLLEDPKRGNINFRVHPGAKFNLDKVFEAIKKKESAKLWFYHASGHLLLNGSGSNPQMPTKLKINELITITKENLLK